MTDTPCPPWCIIPAPHPFQPSGRPGEGVREHVAAFGRIEVREVEETTAEGTAWSSGPLVRVHHDGDDDFPAGDLLDLARDAGRALAALGITG